MDQRLRTLERGEDEGLEVQAALLRARLRAGVLDEERLQLAALLGDPAARAVAPHVSWPSRSYDLARQLANLGWQTLARVALAWARAHWGEDLRELDPSLHALEAVLRAGAPDRGVRETVNQHHERWVQRHLDEGGWIGHQSMIRYADTALALRAAAFAASGGSILRQRGGLRGAVSSQEAATVMFSSAIATSAVDDVLDGTRAEVLPWALGLAEPR